MPAIGVKGSGGNNVGLSSKNRRNDWPVCLGLKEKRKIDDERK